MNWYKIITSMDGGRADNKELSDFDLKKIEQGITVEMEHTNDKEVAQEITMDHLEEFTDYYDELYRMEKKIEKEKK